MFGGIIIPRLILNDTDDQGFYLLNSAMLLGTGICILSLIAGVFIVVIDYYADKKDKDSA